MEAFLRSKVEVEQELDIAVEMKKKACLLLPNEGAPKHTDTLTDHRDIKFFFLEIRNDVLEGGVVLELKAIPKRPFDWAILGLLGRNGLREREEWQSNVNETIFKILKFILAINDLSTTKLSRPTNDIVE